MTIWSQRLASIQKKTSRLKFADTNLPPPKRSFIPLCVRAEKEDEEDPGEDGSDVEVKHWQVQQRPDLVHEPRHLDHAHLVLKIIPTLGSELYR